MAPTATPSRSSASGPWARRWPPTWPAPGFPVTAWNRTAGRAPELDELGVTVAATPAEAVAARRHRRDLRLGHAGRGGRPVRHRTASSTAPGPARLIIDCSTIAPSGSLGLRGAPARARAGDGRRARLGRQRGRPQRDPDDLRRWRRRRRRAGAARPRGARADDHPCRSDRRRSGGQGRQPGHPRRAPISASPKASCSPSRPGSTSSRSSARSVAARPRAGCWPTAAAG